MIRARDLRHRDQRAGMGGQDGDITIDGKRQRVGGWVNDLAVSSDGEVAIAHGRQVSIAGGGVLATHTTTITSLVWHPDERLVAAGSFGRISWISVDDGSADDVELPWGGAVAALRVAEDSGWVAAGGRGDWGVHLEARRGAPCDGNSRRHLNRSTCRIQRRRKSADICDAEDDRCVRPRGPRPARATGWSVAVIGG